MNGEGRRGMSIIWLPIILLLTFTAEAVGSPASLALARPSFTRFQVSAGGVVDPLPAESEAGVSNLVAEFVGYFQRRSEPQLVAFPELTGEERALFVEHEMIFGVLAGEIVSTHRSFARAKLGHLEYTLGPGLSFLADDYGVDKVFLVVGAEVSVSGARALMMVVTATRLLALLQGGQSMIVAAVVDTRSGNIDWFNYLHGYTLSDSPHRANGAASLVPRMMSPFPHSRVQLGREL